MSHDDRLTEIADMVLWLEGGTFRELAGMTTDPVGGMAVDTTSPYHYDRDGQTRSFCSEHCRTEFIASGN